MKKNDQLHFLPTWIAKTTHDVGKSSSRCLIKNHSRILQEYIRYLRESTREKLLHNPLRSLGSATTPCTTTPSLVRPHQQIELRMILENTVWISLGFTHRSTIISESQVTREKTCNEFPRVHSYSANLIRKHVEDFIHNLLDET